MFVNTVLVRNTTVWNTPVIENLLRVQSSILDTLPHRHMPLALLIDKLQVPRDRFEHKVYDVMVNYHAFGKPLQRPPSKQWDLQFLDSDAVHAGLVVDFYDWGVENMQLRVSYCHQIYRKEYIQSIFEDIQNWLQFLSTSDWQAAVVKHIH